MPVPYCGYRSMKILFYSLLFLTNLISSQVACAKEGLTWFVTEIEPLYFSNSPERGAFNVILDLFESKLSNYDHKREMMNFSRVWSKIKNGNPICQPGTYKTKENEKFAVFSRPFAVMYDYKAIVSEDLFQKLNRPQKVSLKKLLKESSLRTATGRNSYGPILDQILKESSPRKSEYISKSENTYKMLQLGRIDYYLELPYIVSYFNKKNSTTDKYLRIVSIEESPPIIELHVACPNTQWGNRIIADINRALDELIPLNTFQDLWTQWAQSDDEVKELAKAYQEKIINFAHQVKSVD